MPAPLFNDYLMHFCGKAKSPRQAQAVLESILRRRKFIPSQCPLFDDPDGALERQHLQAWASMVCFTDLRFEDLHQHVQKFGPYGIALKKHSPPATRCEPVHYVPVGSAAQRNSRDLSDGIHHLLDLQQDGRIDPKWRFPQTLKAFDDRRIASLQDIKTRQENEWRFIGTREDDVLTFAPRDVRFILVQSWAEATRWNARLADPRQTHLHPYGRAGVMAIPVELLLGGTVETRKK